MAEDTPDAEDRSEAATPQRLERARRDGDVALSREAVAAASLAAGSLGLASLGPSAGAEFVVQAGAVLAGAHLTQPGEALSRLTLMLAPLALGVATAATAGALAATFLQTRILAHGRRLRPDVSRLNPVAGAKRLLGLQGLAELARTLLKLLGVGLALWWSMRDASNLGESQVADAATLASDMAAGIGRLLVAATAALFAVAALDLFWVHLRHARRLRMTRQEIRDELKDSEGDPALKARRLQVMRARSRRRVLEAVPKATVVITNPTHYAVALAYERGRDAAPRVVAKGVDAMAARIRGLAEAHGVPIVPNPPLARALWRLEEDAEIPEEHFKAVAEVIAFVFRLRQRAG